MDILSIVIIVIAVIVAIGMLYFAIKNKGLRETAIYFIVEAEKKFEHGKNSEKFNYVFEQVYNRLPTILKFIVTKENVITFIQAIFDEIKIALDCTNISK